MDWCIAYTVVFNFQIDVESLCLASAILGYELVHECLLVVLTTVFEEIKSQALSNNLLKLKLLILIIYYTAILILS